VKKLFRLGIESTCSAVRFVPLVSDVSLVGGLSFVIRLLARVKETFFFLRLFPADRSIDE